MEANRPGIGRDRKLITKTAEEQTTMNKFKSIRRVVTGSRADGKSIVTYDGPSPGAHGHPVHEARGYTDLWVWRETPQPLDGDEDAALWPDEFPGPRGGGHMRVVHWPSSGADPSSVPARTESHEPRQLGDGDKGRSWDRGGGNNLSISDMHKTESVDFGIVMHGERTIVLDDYQTALSPGDVVIEVGAWHLWDSSRIGCDMAFDMISADFGSNRAGIQERHVDVLPPRSDCGLPQGVKPQRRVVTIDRIPGKSSLVSDSASPDFRADPSRPGFAIQRLWVVETHPAPIVPETLHLPHVLVPPPNGVVLNALTFPPDSKWQERVSEADVREFYQSVGAAEICTTGTIPHMPYSQMSNTFDFCLVTEGEITLLLDSEEVTLKGGEMALIRGQNHAWSNRTDSPAVVVIASHDAQKHTKVQ